MKYIILVVFPSTTLSSILQLIISLSSFSISSSVISPPAVTLNLFPVFLFLHKYVPSDSVTPHSSPNSCSNFVLSIFPVVSS